MSETWNELTEAPPASEAPAVIQLPPPKLRRRGGVRRKAADPLNARIELRMTAAQKAAISAEAKRAGMTVTDYLLRNEPGRPRKRRAKAALAAAIGCVQIFVRILGELGKWGSNLNQLAHDRNQRGREPEAEELRLIRVAVWDIRNAVMQALGR